MERYRIKAVILDRDGTLIKHIPYLSSHRDVCLLPGVRDGLEKLLLRHRMLFLHTNQSGVGRKMFPIERVIECNKRMVDLIGFGNDIFRRTCVACEAPDEPPVYRKPEPTFAREVMKQYSLNPVEVCYVGDRLSDLQTAKNAGTFAVGVATGEVDLREEILIAGSDICFPIVSNFQQAVEAILSH